jgi:DNA mismatch repair protein MutS2
VDFRSLEKLEFQAVCELLASFARSELGRKLALRVRPTGDAQRVRLWLTQLGQMLQAVESAGWPPLGGLSDVREQIRRAVPPVKLEPPEYGRIAQTLHAVRDVRRWLASLPAECESLTGFNERLGDFTVVAERIDRVIDPRGQVRDDASDRLARIRRQIEDAREQASRTLQKLLRDPSVLKHLQFPNATFHDDRMVLPVRAEQRGRVPGIVHRASDSGATLFIEPAEAVELNNTILQLRQDESDEVGRLLWELSHLIHLNAREMLRTLDTLAVIDLLAAKVGMARGYQMVVPAMSVEGVLRLWEARHPVLMMLERRDAEAGREPQRVVPIDVRLGEDFDILVITGPNTGGKTCVLKTVGLLAAMMQAGLPIPAREPAVLPVFKDVLIDVGDEQSLQQSLSTFSSHMSHVLRMLSLADRDTLLLIDELGSGTDPDEGAAIGHAILDELRARGCRTLVTTHLGALKAAAYVYPRVDNASVEFDPVTLRPTFHLRIGEPGNSNALQIARRLGMPAQLVDRAAEELAHRDRTLSKAIAGTIRSRRRAERARRAAEHARQKAASAQADAKLRSEELTNRKEEFEDWVRRVAHLRPGDAVRVRSFDRWGTVVRMRLHQQQAEVDLGSMVVQVPLTELQPAKGPAPPGAVPPPTPPPAKAKRPPKAKAPPPAPGPPAPPPVAIEQLAALGPGDEVWVHRFKRRGRIIRMDAEKKLAVVDLGAMEVQVSWTELRLVRNRPTDRTDSGA